MSLISRCQKETAVYWPLESVAQTGEPVWGSPEQITCRWDDRMKEIMAPNMTRVLSSAELITEKKLVVGGLIRRGTLADTAYWDEPKLNGDVFEIIRVCETPNLRYTERLYEAYV